MLASVNRTHFLCRLCFLLTIAMVGLGHCNISSGDVDLEKVSSVFQKYCASCHNPNNSEADLVLATLPQVKQAVHQDSSLVVAGKPNESPLWSLMSGAAEPQMPPKDEPQPTKADLELVKQWIIEGAKLPTASTMPAKSNIASSKNSALVSAACALPTNRIALGRVGKVEFVDRDSKVVTVLDGFAGKITSLRLSPDGKSLVVGSGRVGVSGQISIVDLQTLKFTLQVQGHQDIVYCAAISADGKWLASGSYDRKVNLWDARTGNQLAEVSGHNGAIYDLDFNPTSTLLATASADQTVKLWSIPSGARLDTLGQPEGEMRGVRFSPDGKLIYAAGGDRQIRQWLVDPSATSGSPMLLAKFAHEREVVRMEMLSDSLISTASVEGKVKLWRAIDLAPLGELVDLQSYPIAICQSSDKAASIIDLNGKVVSISSGKIGELASRKAEVRNAASSVVVIDGSTAEKSSINNELIKANEQEPNQSIETATVIQLPAEISGAIATQANSGTSSDTDLYAFEAQAGQEWLIEVFAAKEKSPLDSTIDVLDSNGNPVLQTRLQALRESYFTFRGKDSSTSDDFRMHKWEDMELDEYLYSSGEVTRLWLYPRGPDSGFKVYPGAEARYTFFGTTPVSHALGETAYIVRPLKADEAPLPNGLPVFPIYFENDDDSLRERGADSRLTFKAPANGKYVLRVRDARGFSGDDYRYRITIRRPAPDFSLTFGKLDIATPKGSGREWTVKAKRIDGMNSPIAIRLDGLPNGIVATNPVIIEANQLNALGNLYVMPDFEAPADPIMITLSAETIADVGSKPIVKTIKEKIKLTINQDREPSITLVSKANENGDAVEELSEIIIRPGTTVSATLKVERNGTEGGIGFGKEDSGRNLPHGAFVDNIGLNGLLIVDGQTSREVFITAAPKVQPGRYQFHFRSETKNNPTSKPIWLNVQP